MLLSNFYSYQFKVYENAFVAWPMSNHKILLNRFRYDTETSVVQAIDTIDYLDLFNSTAILQEKPDTDLFIRHSIGYVLILKMGTDYVCDRFRRVELKLCADRDHPKVRYWSLIEELGK